MPDQPTWLERLPDILTSLDTADAPPFLDRPAIELLFGLRRRQAIELMRHMAGYQIGKTFLVDHGAVIGFLKQPRVRQAAEHAIHRKRRVLEHLEAAHRDLTAREIRIPVRSRQPSAGLPQGVELRPGELTIRFQEPIELLEKLFALSQVLADNYDRLMAEQYPLSLSPVPVPVSPSIPASGGKIVRGE